MLCHTKVSQPDTDLNENEFSMSKIMRDLIRDVPKFEHLSSLCISSHNSIRTCSPLARERVIAFRKDFLASVLTPLMNSPPSKTRIEHLHITPLQSFEDPSLTSSVGFVNLLRNIRSLKLKTQNEPAMYAPTDLSLHQQSVDFYTTLPDTWLLPAAQTLKTLYLSADLRWGWYPKVDFRHIHFPHLQSLTLEAFTFTSDWQLEWFLSHGGSLRRLKLAECSILGFVDNSSSFLDSDGYVVSTNNVTNVEVRRQYRFAGRWCHYFKAFAASLPLLQLFSLRRDTELPYSDFEPGYAPAVRDEELGSLRHNCDYNAFTSQKYPPFFNSDMKYPDDPESSIHWQEREQSQRAKDENALLELFDVIERRNTSKS